MFLPHWPSSSSYNIQAPLIFRGLCTLFPVRRLSLWPVNTPLSFGSHVTCLFLENYLATSHAPSHSSLQFPSWNLHSRVCSDEEQYYLGLFTRGHLHCSTTYSVFPAHSKWWISICFINECINSLATALHLWAWVYSSWSSSTAPGKPQSKGEEDCQCDSRYS